MSERLKKVLASDLKGVKSHDVIKAFGLSN